MFGCETKKFLPYYLIENSFELEYGKSRNRRMLEIFKYASIYLYISLMKFYKNLIQTFCEIEFIQ